jgi:SPP1 family predicted phage head-tail adaptor
MGGGMIAHGRLNTRIAIERPESRDIPGKAGKVTEWRNVTMAWAARDTRAGGEQLVAGQLLADSPEIFTMHAQRGTVIDRSMRVVVGGEVFAIEQVRQSADRADLILVCQSGVRLDS